MQQDEWRRQLPDHIRLHVRARFIELSCQRCGWLHVLIREKATPEDVLAVARDHHCPGDPRA